MDSNRLKNCTICGRLFLQVHTDHCLDCYKNIEQDYERVSEFLKNDQNRMATIAEVTEATGVSSKRMTEFIREGRIFADDYPNLGYACSRCGKMIKKQLLCNTCFDDFATDVNRVLKSEKVTDSMVQKQQPRKERGYWHVKNSK
ncbi:TIGR03826 family flagellar region protein [Planococcus shixiaomingii]|uniref:TIGR03826 family flagellar region protein n=1 Tax=Planococcus shixiaomingii TaxID=3058393 RepID=UPI0026017FB2|nr:TIGR03826 family flagellar region protein [Planococcus sp. N022]WKA53924.1 flagellar protein [Planococcus sp. N022]